MSRVSSRLRVGGALGYLLLVAVLTFGVFAMHTMGHPEHSSGPGTGGASHAVAGTHQGVMDQETAEARTATQLVAMTDHGSVAPSEPSEPSADGPLAGMDVLSVCVAVLTGWLLWVFLCAAARRKERLTALLARAMAVLPPLPPPPRPLLAQLSVLRI